MIRKLVAKNMQIRSNKASQKNWRSVELYKHLEDRCDDNKKRL